ncbi:MAG TPA: lamin tail domain-containing protein [Verrucomicrobiae bacterium]|nr:lamin tail domain-containing protein [Verrucomicrobiae bacterium]
MPPLRSVLQPRGKGLRAFMVGLLLWAGGSGRAADFFTMTNASWRFLKGLGEASSPDPAAWRQRDFNDSTWALGRSPFFYSTAPTEPPFYMGGLFTGTLLADMQNAYTCVFLRIPVVLDNPGAAGALTLEAESDDGFIAWINGVEVARQNMPAGFVPFNGTAVLSPVEPIPSASYNLTNADQWLVRGVNILAVQAFNRSLDSSDFGFMATLSSSIDDSPPLVLSLNPPAGATVRALTKVAIVFNEPVTNLTAGDLVINGVPATRVTTNDAREFVFEFLSPSPGLVTAAWATGHGIADFAGNAFAGGSWGWQLDPNLPPATVVISEFMADNSGVLRDEDGDSSDWIEIYNPGIEVAPLDGWFLTDDPATLAQWRFPAVELAPNGYLIVFASGKDRAIPGTILHTNFKLDDAGDYLALVRPDGTVASEFGPTYPKQRRDVSYGVAREIVSEALVPLFAAAKVFSPRDGILGLSWTGELPFDDSAAAGWLATVTGIGFDQGSPGGSSASPLGYWSFDDSSDPTQARDLSGHQHDGAISGATFSPDGGGRSGRPGDRAMNFGPANNGAYINVTDASTGWFDSATARDEVTFALWVFGDESEPGINSAFYVSQNPDGTGVRVANAHLPWQDSTIYWDTGGYAPSQRVSYFEPDQTKWKGRWNHYAFVKQGSSKQIWQNGTKILDGINTDPLQPARGFVIGAGANLNLWTYGGLIDDFAVWDVALEPAQIQALAAGATPLDLDTYAPLLGADLGPLLRNQNASALVRLPFIVNAIDFDTLLLRVRYDDGFVCWLNGVEAVRRNVPAALAWNSAATRKRTKNEARTVEELNLSALLGSLRIGTNILAFQVLNSSAADAEMLLLPELLAGRSNSRVYFTNATPGAPNETGVADFVADTRFSVDRGFYFSPTNVHITTATPGAYIVYTQDGTVPTPLNGRRVAAAAATLAPTATVVIATTTLLRAAAFKDGWQPTDVDTHTYLFPGSVGAQTKPGWLPATWPDGSPLDVAMDARIVNNPRPGYSLTNSLLAIPSLSVVMPSNDLFSASGLYANPLETGPAWERAASAELMFPDGRPGFHVQCGLRIHGGVSRYKAFTPKHSFSLLFRRAFGASKLDFPVFPASSVHEFDQILLRGCSTDSWPVQDGASLNGEPWPRWIRDEASYMRDQWMRDAQNALGHPSAHGAYVHLYLDGVYWGLYNLAERPDDSFAASYFGGQREEFDVISDVNDLHAGTWTAWSEMFSLASAGLATDAALQRLLGNYPDGSRNPAYPVYLDLTNLIDYMILHIACGADDWPEHNWWASRRQGPQSEGFRFFSWDQEITNNSLQRQRTSFSPYPLYADASTFNSPAYLYSQMRGNAEFRVLFGDRVHRHLFNQGALTVATNTARWQARHDELDHAIVAESARWGDYRRPTQPYRRELEWVSNQTWMVTTYFPSNLVIALNRFRAAGLYPQLGGPSFSQFGGNVPAGFQLTVSDTNGTGAAIYYTLDGSDPRRAGGALSPSARLYTAPVPINAPTLVRARVLKNSLWSALTETQFYSPQDFTHLQLSELMYNPPRFGTNDGDEVEFLELKNTGPSPLDLTGLNFSEGIQFTFPAATTLAPGQFFVLARNPEVYALRYPGAPLHGVYTGHLDNGGETIAMSTALGVNIFSVRYDNAAPWPAETDNSGLSLQRMNFTVAATNATAWIAAPPTPGSPLAEELMDDDADGIPNGWERAHGLDPGFNDAAQDDDHDGLSNRQEFLAGTDPRDPKDVLRLASLTVTATLSGLRQTVVGFSALSNKTYSVLWRNPVLDADWTNLVHVGAAPTNRLVFVTNSLPAGISTRFYRLATPRLP